MKTIYTLLFFTIVVFTLKVQGQTKQMKDNSIERDFVSSDFKYAMITHDLKYRPNPKFDTTYFDEKDKNMKRFINGINIIAYSSKEQKLFFLRTAVPSIAKGLINVLALNTHAPVKLDGVDSANLIKEVFGFKLLNVFIGDEIGCTEVGVYVNKDDEILWIYYGGLIGKSIVGITFFMKTFSNPMAKYPEEYKRLWDYAKVPRVEHGTMSQ